MHSRFHHRLIIALWLPAWAGPVCAASASDPADVAAGLEPEEVQTLRERLTEREDENRLSQPTRIELGEHALLLSGELEAVVETLDQGRRRNGTRTRQTLFEPELEVEAFLPLRAELSLFAQVRGGTRLAWDGAVDERGGYIERGEMWLYAQNLGGTGLDLDVGRLDFEDDRLWWWDSELDAIRIEREWGEFDVALAYAVELARASSAAGFIDPEQDDVRRLILESAWDWHPEHTLQWFALLHDDRSHTHALGDELASAREDGSDARLNWLGVRAAGAFDRGRSGQFAYWLDAGRVHGDERIVEFEPSSDRTSEVDEVRAVDVRGWGIDAGMTYVFATSAAPRFSLGYARGSGDDDPDDAVDHRFRQTGLHGNEVGFGGVQRFAHYGLVLDPELSNLAIVTANVGCSLFESSSLDLSYNRYRLVDPRGELRDLRVDLEPRGNHAGVGEAFDLLLALEEDERFQFELSASMYRPGSAFGAARPDWMWAGLLAVRIAF